METLSAPQTPLQADLVAMLHATRDAERDLFAGIPLFARRHDLAELAKDDPDLIALRAELTAS